MLKCHPDEIKRISGNYYQLKKHDSLKLDHGLWHWYSQKVGGRSAVDLLIKVEGMKFIEAVSAVYEEYFNKNPETDVRFHTFTKEMNMDKEALTVPAADADNNEAIKYLQKRKISNTVIGYAIKQLMIYQEKVHKNVVFVGFDYSGHPTCYAMRGTKGAFHQVTAGSDKRYPFRILNNPISRKLHLFEAPIDLLSYMTLYVNDQNMNEFNGMSLLGVADYNSDGELPVALDEYLRRFKLEEAYIHFDSDSTGKKAAEALKSMLEKRNIRVYIMYAPEGKDFNEYLQIKAD